MTLREQVFRINDNITHDTLNKGIFCPSAFGFTDDCKTGDGNCKKCWDKEYSDDVVNCPAHYTDGKIEVIEYIEDKKFGFHLGNAIKYISRAGKKDKSKEVEDLKKAIWYIQRRIKELEEMS